MAAVPEDDTCAICLDVTAVGERICTLRCGHSCCYKCIEGWFEREKNCPLCRTRFASLRSCAVSIKASGTPDKTRVHLVPDTAVRPACSTRDDVTDCDGDLHRHPSELYSSTLDGPNRDLAHLGRRTQRPRPAAVDAADDRLGAATSAPSGPRKRLKRTSTPRRSGSRTRGNGSTNALPSQPSDLVAVTITSRQVRAIARDMGGGIGAAAAALDMAADEFYEQQKTIDTGHEEAAPGYKRLPRLQEQEQVVSTAASALGSSCSWHRALVGIAQLAPCSGCAVCGRTNAVAGSAGKAVNKAVSNVPTRESEEGSSPGGSPVLPWASSWQAPSSGSHGVV
jgi:hypothetical protein